MPPALPLFLHVNIHTHTVTHTDWGLEQIEPKAQDESCVRGGTVLSKI